MDKLAQQVKMADVTGCEAAFVRLGLVKVASDEEFNQLCENVCNALGDADYDLDKIAAVTMQVQGAGAAPLKKAASANNAPNEAARNAALGELLLMKTAGQIDDATFRQEAEGLMKMAMPGMQALRNGAGWVGNQAAAAGNSFVNALKGRDIRSGIGALKARSIANNAGRKALLRSGLKEILAGAGKGAAAYGTIGAGLGGAGYLGKSLYDKYAE